jgi:hypothetical protein
MDVGLSVVLGFTITMSVLSLSLSLSLVFLDGVFA